MDMQGKVAIVTGASSGIGMATTRIFGKMGMKVVATGRREERLRHLAEDMCRQCVTVVGDIADPTMPQKLLDRALSEFGRCDVVINNAGVMEVGPIEQVDIDRVCRMVRVNVEAAYRMAYVAMKHFKQQNAGHLVNISSTLGTKTRENVGAYSGTKYAIEALSEGLRMEMAKTGVRVSVIEPGLTETELQDHFPVHPREAMKVSHLVQPEDIARAIRFVLEQPPHVRVPKLMMVPSEQAV